MWVLFRTVGFSRPARTTRSDWLSRPDFNRHGHGHGQAGGLLARQLAATPEGRREGRAHVMSQDARDTVRARANG